MIDLRYVKKLLEMLDESTVDSMEISSDKGMRIRLQKTPVARGTVQYAAPAAAPAPAPAPAAPVAAAAPAAAPAAAAAPASKGQDVKSPMVGTFYGAPEPGAKPYVSVGQTVKKGQVLCIIEAMKIMNEIESEVAGKVVEILATDAQPVEYGQVLFRVDPNG
ncbi:acetyl-CoA carboxylase biotin carboxyl carrier protein [Pseudogemmatithrix spongiicola]|uniref:Biotin carboxyl carrier protein of acetyl-CoA carboxylase n=1 Tax=Pseudogemmatithrix spongiicola TaxID=3062599 RepID=A0AA49JV00_9BACT|nr:acetyl-CoA carboxylase biotin carboxyl carrier protein [Gemmatimonadaceae bacterium 'strain 138']WKW15403.1 acetyl-CoA carboxylase biotin carboxyl carrier protein [Gemmatimonadaceae bacterium 'strain 318']